MMQNIIIYIQDCDDVPLPIYYDYSSITILTNKINLQGSFVAVPSASVLLMLFLIWWNKLSKNATCFFSI